MNTVQKDKDGCILEVDLEYPKKLHDSHNGYFLSSKKMRSQKVCYLIIVEKLQISTIFPLIGSKRLYQIKKNRYALHCQNLQLYLQ